MKKVDVAIIGGGLVGNLLARQLRRHVPNAGVSLFERETERTFKVGESTVEVATHYLIKRLGLSTYFYQHHLPKYGLRYFFDNEQKNADLPEMSEIGIAGAPVYPSFQIDRCRMEEDLLAMNAEDGVDVQLGARVTNLRLSEGGKHHFEVITDGESVEYEARWVIDGTGREGIINKQQKQHFPETSQKIASAWGRFTGVTDIDGIDAPDWHARANHTSRMLSTNHFMYEGYWIWFIPLRNGLTSLGVVQQSSDWSVDRHKAPGFLKFLREHKAVASLLENAESVDMGAMTQLAFRTKRFYSENRWATIGDSAAFPDPFYSPGSDFIAIGNDFVADLIDRDLKGEDIAERTDAYGRMMQYRYDTTMAIYDGLYPTLGSYELMAAKIYFDTGTYYNLIFDSYVKDEHLDLRKVRSALRRGPWGKTTMDNYNKMFRAATKELKQAGTYYRANLGEFEPDPYKSFGITTDIGQERSRRVINERNEELFQQTQKRVAAVLGKDSAILKTISAESRELYDAWSQL